MNRHMILTAFVFSAHLFSGCSNPTDAALAKVDCSSFTTVPSCDNNFAEANNAQTQLCVWNGNSQSCVATRFVPGSLPNRPPAPPPSCPATSDRAECQKVQGCMMLVRNSDNSVFCGRPSE